MTKREKRIAEASKADHVSCYADSSGYCLVHTNDDGTQTIFPLTALEAIRLQKSGLQYLVH